MRTPQEAATLERKSPTMLVDSGPRIRRRTRRTVTKTIERRDRLAHRYFDTSHAIAGATATDDLPELEAAVRRLIGLADDT